MVNVTDRARYQLKRVVTSKLGESRRRPRLVVARPGAFGLVPDDRRPDDQCVEHEGAVILLIGRDVSDIVGDSMLDYEETGGHAQLVIRRLRRHAGSRPAGGSTTRGACTCESDGCPKESPDAA